MSFFKIIAGPIGNLSDARYFAARDVDHILFKVGYDSTDTLSVEAFNAMKEWIEGPEVLVWRSIEDEGKIKLAGIDCSITCESSALFSGEGILDLKNISYSELQRNRDQLRKFAAVMVPGGAEEKPGVKSFEDIDRIMDLLDEIKNPDSP